MYPKSIELWKLYMHHYIENPNDIAFHNTFDRAIKNISPADSIPLWQINIIFVLSSFEMENVTKNEKYIFL